MGYAFQREASSGSAKVEAPYKALSADELRRGEHPRRLKDEGRMPELGPPTQKPQKATLKPQPPQQTTAKEAQPVEQPTTQPTQKQLMEQPSKSQPPKEVVKKKKGKKHDIATAEGHEGLEQEMQENK
jgi:hypothetical protein